MESNDPVDNAAPARKDGNGRRKSAAQWRTPGQTLVPMNKRRLVAVKQFNTYRPGTATYTHYGIVLAAGPLGITLDELAHAIEESASNGRQTGVALARWSFNCFVRMGVAKQIVQQDGEWVDYRLPDSEVRRSNVLAEESTIPVTDSSMSQGEETSADGQ